MTAAELSDTLDALEFSELKTLKTMVETAIHNREKAERAALIDQMNALAKERGFKSLDALLDPSTMPAPETKKRKPVAPKYRNPADASQTWTGRGRKPKWVEEMINAGGSLDDALIAISEAA